MDYALAGFVNGENATLATSCFCRKFADIYEQVYDINLCRDIPCSGDPSFSCGSDQYVLAYKMNKAFRINKLTKPSDLPAVMINTFETYNIEFKGLNITNNFNVNQPYTQIGQETLTFGPTDESFYDPTVK